MNSGTFREAKAYLSKLFKSKLGSANTELLPEPPQIGQLRGVSESFSDCATSGSLGLGRRAHFAVANDRAPNEVGPLLDLLGDLGDIFAYHANREEVQ